MLALDLDLLLDVIDEASRSPGAAGRVSLLATRAALARRPFKAARVSDTELRTAFPSMAGVAEASAAVAATAGGRTWLVCAPIIL
jgi:hypothetical protein